MIYDEDEDDYDVGFEWIDDQSPSRKIGNLNKSLPSIIQNATMETQYLGYINQHYEFIFPKVDLEGSDEGEEMSNLDKLNIFKAFSVNNSRHNEIVNKRAALDLIRGIVTFEVDKYRTNLCDEQLVKAILNYDSLMANNI
jgi:hypothetical protein